jgi:hypothetical protein
MTHGNEELGRLELRQRDVDRDAPLALRLELVQNPCCGGSIESR